MSDTIETPLETLSINNDKGSTFNYVNNCLVKKFYEFMADIYIEHKKLNEKNVKDLQDDKTVKPLQPFPQYFLYKLYYHYGVKRRMANDHIALLYYSKTAKGYKNTEPITMLCRHMLLDLKCMRIISLGIPKAVKLNDFCNTYSINKADASTNYMKKDDTTNDDKTTDDKNNKYDMYYFSEGTMMTYNPSLSKYNFTFVECDDSEDEDDNDEPKPKTETKTEIETEPEPEPKHKPETEDTILLENSLDIEKPVEIKFVNQFIYSTRKILGTGHFNSYKSFLQMFLENNMVNKIDLTKIPEEYVKDTVLVFNIEHPDNNIISTIKRNSNILCGVFKFKNEEQSNQEFEKITTITYSLENENDIKKHFEVLGHTMVTQIKVKDFKQHLYDNNIKINLQLPKLIKYFEKSTSEKSTSEKSTDDKEDKSSDVKKDKEIDVNTFSLEQLEYIVDNKSKFFHGYIIYGKNGERTKIANKKYKDLCELKGNKPITLEQCNIKNLFYLYIRLIKQKNVQKFLKEFDTENTSSATITNPLPFQFTLTSYKQIFMWFYSLVNNYAIKLFKVYHYSFVKKTFEKKNIPFSLKPMCGDLHTLYKSNSVPITKSFIEQYLVEQPASKLYWRLFDNTKDETITINE